MGLDPGARLGPYEIVSPLGAGGMGEVYRVRDTRLKREVALKVLLENFAQDPDRLARFQREAELLATLNHPNIAAIYGLEKADGLTGIVLELVDGPTLAERIAQGPMPLDEALATARQIADALEAAHEKGVIHRDLKPANIKLTPAEQVKVLDFGLAKLADPWGVAGPAGLTQSPTVSVQPTFAGVILGTAAYMSPEQARGKPVDRRTDIWAFGCVLFEMLTGRQAFGGDSLTDVFSSITRDEPAWQAFPAATPAYVGALVRRCLQKDPRKRLRDIGEARIAIEESATMAPVAAGQTATAPQPATVLRARPLAVAGTGLVIGIVGTAILAWAVMRPVPQRPPEPVRFAIVPPPAQPLAISGFDGDIAISPDGSHIVYQVGGGTQQQLVVRALGELEARPLADRANMFSPFISPDGHWVGYFAAGGDLKKVSITGGPPITLCRFAGAPRGASWGPGETIIFATADRSTGLLSVPAGGGEPKTLTKPDTAHGEGDHLFPSVLPGGRAVLFTVGARQGEDAQVAVLDLNTGQRRTLIRGGTDAVYVETGHLVYAAAGTLRAVRFDLDRLEVRSDPVPVAEHVMAFPSGAANFALSRGGTLVYVPAGGGLPGGVQRSLVWVNHQGREDPIKAPLRAYLMPRVSPDGTRLALDIRDQENDIWIWDLTRETLTRLTFDPTVDSFPVWTPDSRRIIFASERSGTANLHWQAADGTGSEERLTTSENLQLPLSMAPDGTRVVFVEIQPKTGADLFLLSLGGPSTGLATAQPHVEPLIQTSFDERAAEISPDGRWVAYESNASGQDEVYVRPFPNVNAGRWQVSPAGGTKPAWARSGRELFYLDMHGALTAVPVQTTGPTFSPGNPTKVFATRYFAAVNNARTYDVSPDGQRFLMIKDNAQSEQASTATPASLVVVEHWVEELKARVGTK